MSTPAHKPATTPIPVQLSEPEFTAFILPHLSMPKRGPKCTLGYHRVFNLILWVLYTKSCQVAPLLAVGRNGILVRGFGGQIPPTEQTASFEGQVEAERAMSAECPPALKAPPQAAGIFTESAVGAIWGHAIFH